MKKNIQLITIALFVMLFSGVSEANWNMDFAYLEGKTDSTGRFTIRHKYLATPSTCEGTFIVGATVAIQSPGNKQWYTLADRNENWHAISWGDNMVSGYFGLPGYENQPVRVVLFLTHRIC